MKQFADIATTAMKATLTVSEIANITKKERSTVVRWIKAGRLGQVKKVGGDYEIPLENFRDFWEKSFVTLDSKKK